MYDACLSGYGVVTSDAPLAEAEQLASIDERWRFKDFGHQDHRTQALFLYEKEMHQEPVGDVLADIATVLPAPRLDRVLCMDDSFPDFSARLLHQEKWHEVLLSSSLNLFTFAKLGQVYRLLNTSLGTTSIM